MRPRLIETADSVLLERRRLLGAIDEGLTKRRCVALTGPGGVGKTVLARQYVAGSGCPALWFRLPPVPGDLVQLARELAKAAMEVCSHLDLGRFELEIADAQADEGSIFATLGRLLLDVAAGVSGNWLVVMDDLHHVQAQETALRFTSWLTGMLPPNAKCLMTSRVPVSRLHRPWAETVAEIGEDEIRFTRGETHAFFRDLHGIHLSGEQLRDLDERVQGWVLALTLLAAGGHPADAGASAGDNGDLGRRLFGELLAGMTPALRRRLCCLALVDEFVPDEIHAVAPWPERHADVDFLLQRGVLQRTGIAEGGASPLALHPLFREYLRERGVRELGSEEREEVFRTAARCLEAQGDGLAAAHLYLDTGGEKEAVRAVLGVALREIRRGRPAALLEVTRRFSGETLEGAPWLMLAHASALLEVSSPEAGSLLERSVELFREEGDEIGELLSLVQLINFNGTILGKVQENEGYLERAEALYARHEGALEGFIKAKVNAYIGISNLFLRAEHQVARWHFQEALQIAQHHGMVNLACRIRYFLALQKMMVGRLGEAGEEIERLHAKLHNPVLSRSNRLLVLGAIANWYEHMGFFPELLRLLDRARDRLSPPAEGKETIMAYVARWQVEALMDRGDLRKARALIEEALGWDIVSHSLNLRSEFLETLGMLEALAGNRGAALEAARESRELRAKAGEPHQTSYNHATVAATCALASEYEEAEYHHEQALALARKINKPQVLASVWLYRALMRLYQDRPDEAEAAYGRFAGVMRDHGFCHCPDWVNAAVRPLFEHAAAEGWEADLTRRFLEEKWDETLVGKRILPRLHLRLLGGFELHIQGRKIAGAEDLTPQQREFLALLATQDGLALSQAEVQRLFWEGAEPEKARASFDTTLSRLRRTLKKLLPDGNVADYLQLRNGILRLKACVVDAAEFEAAADHGLECVGADRPWEAGFTLERAVECYGGVYASAVDSLYQVLDRRALLEEKYVRCVLALATIRQGAGQTGEAMDLLRRALALCPEDEALYRALYSLYCKRGMQRQAADLLQRCRRALAAAGHSDEEIDQIILNVSVGSGDS